MSIVSAVNARVVNMGDKLHVLQRFTDQDGKNYDQWQYVPAGYDIAALLVTKRAALEEWLVQAEIEAILGG